MFALFMFYVIQFYEFTSISSIIKLSISVIVIEIALFSIIYPFLAVSKKRIIPIHYIFLSDGTLNAQLESINTERNWKLTGRHIRKLRVVSYSAKCPICSSRVELENGGKEFHSRLIGRCLEAPDEHIFSFDRTNRTGYPLREYYQVMYSDNKKQN